MDYNILIHKKLSGQITDEEEIQLDEWLAIDSANQMVFDEIKLIWVNAEEDDEEVSDDHFNEELRRLESTVQASVNKEKLIRNYRIKGRIKNMAIVLLLMAGGYLFVTQYHRSEVSRSICVANNEHHEVRLSDSSQVVLNDSSSLIFEESTRDRRANLNGEAFFTVTKDQRPFVVETSQATISVLGTSFIVKAHPSKPVEVYVLSGRVKVSFHGKDTLLSPSEKAVVGGDENIFYTGINGDPNFNSWYTRRLEFNKTELRTILSLIEQLYDITFMVQDEKILDCRFTGIFDHAKMENILKTLSFSMDIQFKSRIGNYYEVSGKGCVP